MNTPTPVSRRFFIRQGALAFASIGAGALFGPGFLRSSLFAAEPLRTKGGRRVLVCIFQRGAVDGMSMVVPHGDPYYYRLRSDIAIAPPFSSQPGAALDLDGTFGLHPALAPLREIYGAGELAVLQACGNPNGTRSHFDAQDFMEAGTDHDKALRSGWLSRMLSACPEDSAHRSPLRALAMSAQMPRSLQGDAAALAIADLARFKVAPGARPAVAATISQSFEELYASPTGDALHGAGQDGFAAIDLLRKVDPAHYRPAAGADYPASPFGRSLRQIAQLIKSDVGLEVAFANIGGWDTHANQGGAHGQLADRLGEFSQALAAFHRDLGPKMSEVLVLTMSEFGRTARQNGNRGTDHGHGTAFFALGGPVRGGKVYGRWPGLAPGQLNQDRDLAITTDFRDFFAEAAVRHMGVSPADLGKVFPEFSTDTSRFPGFLGT